MTSLRHKPSAGFWITMALLALLVAYPLSFVPACWISSRLQPSGRLLSATYRPIILAWRDSPPSVEDLVSRGIFFGIRGYRIQYKRNDRGGIESPRNRRRHPGQSAAFNGHDVQGRVGGWTATTVSQFNSSNAGPE